MSAAATTILKSEKDKDGQTPRKTIADESF
jgi:hypothetical protein